MNSVTKEVKKYHTNITGDSKYRNSDFILRQSMFTRVLMKSNE